MSEERLRIDQLIDQIVIIQDKILVHWGIELLEQDYYESKFIVERHLSFRIACAILILKKRGFVYDSRINKQDAESFLAQLKNKLKDMGLTRIYRRFLARNLPEDARSLVTAL